MTRLSEKLEGLVIEKLSADNAMAVTLKRHRRVSMRMADPKALEHYARWPHTMAAELSGALDRLWADYRTTVQSLLAEFGAPPGTEDHWDANVRRYRASLKAVRLVGMSPGQILRIGSTNLTDFSIRVRPGAMEGITEQRFVSEVQGALEAMQAHRQNELTRLKNQHFDTGLVSVTKPIHALSEPSVRS